MAIGRGAKRIYDEYEDDIGVEISEIHKSTALHIAAAVKHVDFVKELVKIMDENDLRKKNKFDNTAFFLAAASGMVEAAKEIMKNDTAIAMVPDICGRLPIHMAALSGHKDMVEYLYQKTGHFLSEQDRKMLFFSCIETDLYGKHCYSSFCSLL